jgi:hypothetical protein
MKKFKSLRVQHTFITKFKNYWLKLLKYKLSDLAYVKNLIERKTNPVLLCVYV